MTIAFEPSGISRRNHLKGTSALVVSFSAPLAASHRKRLRAAWRSCPAASTMTDFSIPGYILGAQLPLVVPGTYYDQYEPSALPEKPRSLDAFLDKIANEMKFSRPINAKGTLQVVCSVLACHVDDGHIAKI